MKLHERFQAMAKKNWRCHPDLVMCAYGGLGAKQFRARLSECSDGNFLGASIHFGRRVRQCCCTLDLTSRSRDGFLSILSSRTRRWGLVACREDHVGGRPFGISPNVASFQDGRPVYNVNDLQHSLLVDRHFSDNSNCLLAAQPLTDCGGQSVFHFND